jgi:wyosine [tRNA(Phe)-imidazoG37] synthetase (radical SAM superfamily)
LAQKAKVCPFSCTYCQYGPTAQPTLLRRSFVSAQQLKSDLDALGPVECDQVTFAGLGEPTLARNLPGLVDIVRSSMSTPIAILTGSALLPRADVRRDLLPFDHVVVKLDAPNGSLFRLINRPGHGYPYSWDALVEGIRLLRQAFSGHVTACPGRPRHASPDGSDRASVRGTSGSRDGTKHLPRWTCAGQAAFSVTQFP